MTVSWKMRLGFLGPLVLLPGLLVVWPAAELLILSLKTQVVLFDVDRWVGLDNFIFLFTQDLRFWNALTNTLFFTLVSVGLELALGLALALYLRFARDPAWLKMVLLLPWAIPNVISARLWQWMFHSQAGLINYCLETLGLVSGPVPWLASPDLAMHCAIIADVWKTTPFMTVLLYAGLQSLPESLLQAARVDRTPPWRFLHRIVLPLLRPAIVTALLLRGLDAFRVFDVIYVMTGGGPANSTETLSLYIYRTYFQALQFGYGSAVVLVQVAAMLALAALLIRLRRPAGGGP
ncbi:MAG: carbohydrate ABC transporter permease [Nitrospinaceae bacterium]